MRLLPQNMDQPPEDSGADSVEIDATTLEPAPEQTLFERLQEVAIEIAPQHMRQVVYDKVLQPEHIPIILLRVQGYRHYEIAQIIGKGTGLVHRVLNSQAGQAMLTRLYAEAGFAAADAGRAFVEAAPMAADVVIELAENAAKEETRLKAAFSILDRAGYGAVKKNESVHKVEVGVSNVTVAELSDLRQALREAIEVEAEFEVVEQEPASSEEEEVP